MQVKESTVKEAQDTKFDWINPKRVVAYDCKSDVTISKIKGGIYSFTFRNKCWKHFDDSIEFAIYKNRMLFRHSDVGMILRPKNGAKSDNRYSRLAASTVPKSFSKFVGNHTLKYDQFYELYYIEIEEEDE